jgi:nitroreductase
MDFFELIQARYSVRAFQSKPVEKEKLDQIFEAVRLAPTAANRQPFRFFVLRTKDKTADLLRVYGRDWFVQAPLVIAACAEPSKAWTRMDTKNYGEVDTTIAMDHLILAAANLGLGTCWIAAFNPVIAREVFNLPDEVEPLALTPLGYPADSPKTKKRKSLSELVFYI